MQRGWEFWIDVGGTFTDCLARSPDGQLKRHKVLSSAVTKGNVASGSHRRAIVDPARRADPAGFWIGYQLRLISAEGNPCSWSAVVSFDQESGTLECEPPLDADPAPGQTYELFHGDEAPLLAIRYLLGLRCADPIPPLSVRLGTTRGTNALITRRGARTALVTTRGMGDVLEIGYQNRPRLFELSILKRSSLVTSVLEVNERLNVSGEVILEPDWDEVRRDLAALRRAGIESLAICLLHAYRNAQHELQIEQLAREVGFEEISCSSRVAPLIKLVARGDTTTVDAYLNPVLRGYVRQLKAGLGADSACDLRMLTSAGGLVDADQFLGKDSILSGPAGGVVGFSRIAAAAGYDRAIGFDMGGTSTDVTRFDGECELQYETEKAGVRIVSPMMAIETVAAGGGSICQFDGVKLTVGPDSAGADPGPACYGRGGPLTVTDMNFYTGRIRAAEFPFALHYSVVEDRLAVMRAGIAQATGRTYELTELAHGFLRVANANMAKAVRSISVARGYDPREYVLVPFGGAAPQHACAIAEELGMDTILNHPDAGVLSAFGIGMADVVRHRVAGVYRPLDEESLAHAQQIGESLAQEAMGEVLESGVGADRIAVTLSLDLRYLGTDACLTIARPADDNFEGAFTQQHERRYGYTHSGRGLEIVAVRLQATGRSDVLPDRARRCQRREVKPSQWADVYFGSAAATSTAIVPRSTLRPGDVLRGGAIITEPLSTTVVDPGWEAEMLSGGELLMRRIGDKTPGDESPHRAVPEAAEPEQAPNPVDLELFNNRFAGIAEKMGLILRNTSCSVNVKERLDFSCALFTASGDLVVNAPHIPVHLGAMSETVKCLIADTPAFHPGDVFVTNDPFRGGSHLPDVTVVTPVHRQQPGEPPQLLFFTASRAHHAEIGGITPGSMPPFSQNLAEEGVVIRQFQLMDQGVSRFEKLRDLLQSAPFPSRAVNENLADIAAQVAANRQGAEELLELISRKGVETVQAYMRHIQAAAERKMRAAISRLPSGRHHFTDYLDDGVPIAVTITVNGDSAIVDFQGTGEVQPGNLNANRAIVTAAVMYVFRCLIEEDIPLNEGVLAPLEIRLPACLLNPPRRDDPRQCAAVAGGNVETSQRVVDVLLGALGVAAASQGTMNNLLFGDHSFGYYETICGGSGATAQQDGASAVQTHMTNTRLTDPEVLELRYPVRLHEFAIRRGSGGAGRHRGGDGVIRRMEFLRPVQVSLLTQRRGDYPPYGLNGGLPGAAGRNELRLASGERRLLPAQIQVEVQPGDQLTIETPGGGGWGEPSPSQRIGLEASDRDTPHGSGRGRGTDRMEVVEEEGQAAWKW